MNKNIDNYKKAVDQIHVDSDLKDKVLEQAKAKQKSKSSIYYLRYATAIAAVAVVAVVGVNFLNKPKEEVFESNKNFMKQEENEDLAKVDIRRFENIEELRKVLEENASTNRRYYGFDANEDMAVAEKSTGVSETQNATSESSNANYSRTNNQVESVDEADIIKTDGKYIYYSQNNRIYIVDNDLNLKATIFEEKFYPNQIFVNGEKLVVFGSKQNYVSYYRGYDLEDSISEDDEDVQTEEISTINRPKVYVRVYDLKNIEKPKKVREIKVDGNYQDSRMIENNVYLVTNYYNYFYNGIDELKDIDILPSYEDSVRKGINYIDATDIAYFENKNDTSYSLIVGFCLDSKEEASVETFFGSGSEMYVSENNLYLITPNGYSWNADSSTIYKFKLEDGKVYTLASGTVQGTVGDQFAMDEYKGNLRVATTSYKSGYNFLTGDYYSHYRTHLTIFDENLEKIGGIDELIKDEEIYAVRFIGKVGYIVTFQEIDPLWVIDLSDPTNPVVKGELEIPGYSSYLHPYDEKHVIGIGYNVKSNGYGGVRNDTIKISMFDVSDVRNPKEIFNKTLDQTSASSEIMYDHKALFFNKDENLIGFPVSWWTNRSSKSGLILYRIDMENEKFEEIDDLIEKTSYSTIERAIYIGDAIYTVHTNQIIKYDMKTFEKIKTLELEGDRRYNYYY